MATTTNREQLVAQAELILGMLENVVEDLVRKAVAAGPGDAQVYYETFDHLQRKAKPTTESLGTLRQMLLSINKEAEDHRREWDSFARLVQPKKA